MTFRLNRRGLGVGGAIGLIVLILLVGAVVFWLVNPFGFFQFIGSHMP